MPLANLDSMRLSLLLTQAYGLRNQLLIDIESHNWTNNDYRMDEFNQLRGRALALLPDDSLLESLPEMPDVVMRSGWGQTAPPESASARTSSLVTQLINHVEFLFPGFVRRPPQPAVVAGQPFAALTEDEREAYEIAAALAGSETVKLPLDERDFAWISDAALRETVRLDFAEAQRALAAGAYKGAAILAASAIEGMVLEVLVRRPSAAAVYEAATKPLRKNKDGTIDWDRVSLVPMMTAAVEIGLASSTHLKWVQGTADVRDTVHPRGEGRQGTRAGREEALLFLTLARLLYRDFAALGTSQSTDRRP